MKKTIMVIISALLLLVSCTGGETPIYQKIKPGLTDNKEIRQLYGQENVEKLLERIEVFNGKNTVITLTLDGNFVQDFMVFSDERECIYIASDCVNGFKEPIELEEELESLIGQERDEIVRKYGPFHFLVGSGVTGYCYVLSDGYWISLYMDVSDDDKLIVSSVIKLDPMNGNKKVEEYGF